METDMSEHSAEKDAAYREQAEALIADLRARLAHMRAEVESVAAEWSRNPYSMNPVQRLYKIVDAAFPPEEGA